MTVDTQCCGDSFTLLFQLISTLGNTCTGGMIESHATEPTVSTSLWGIMIIVTH